MPVRGASAAFRITVLYPAIYVFYPVIPAFYPRHSRESGNPEVRRRTLWNARPSKTARLDNPRRAVVIEVADRRVSRHAY